MKKLFLMLAFLGTVAVAMADWTYGTCYFLGNQPSRGLSIGGVRVWYNGELKETRVMGGVQYWEGTGEICVVYPKDYNGPKLVFLSSGGSVQVQYQK